MYNPINFNNNMRVSKSKILTVLSLFLVLGAISATYFISVPQSDALNTCATGWQVGTSKTVNCHSVCRVVSKSGAGSDFFVPTASSTEWGNFRSVPPSNASFSTCSGGNTCSSVYLCGQGTVLHSYNICGAGCAQVYNTACNVICSGSNPGKNCQHVHNVYCDSVTTEYCYTTYSSKTEPASGEVCLPDTSTE